MLNRYMSRERHNTFKIVMPMNFDDDEKNQGDTHPSQKTKCTDSFSHLDAVVLAGDNRTVEIF